MKHLSKLAAIFAALALACAFIGCSNESSSDDNNSSQNSSNSGNTNSGSSSSGSFDDCTVAATEVTLADGNWTIKTVSDDESKGQYSENNIKATKSGETLTFNSGSRNNTIDLSKMMSAEALTAFNNLTDEEKKEQVRNGMGLPDDVTITFTGNICTVTGALTESALNEYKTKLSGFISSANEIKTNSDKTKYAITKEFDHEAPVKIYFSKD